MAKGEGRTSRKSPAAIAAEMLGRDRFLTDDADAIHTFTGTHWEELSKARLRALVFDAEDGSAAQTASRRNEIVEVLKAKSHHPGHQWGRVGDGEVACKNVVVDVVSGELRNHDPDDYLEKVIPWPYRAAAPCKSWARALEEWFPDDAGAGDQESRAVDALQEFFGYVVLSHAKFKKALILYGPESDTGKSTVIFVLQHLVGAPRCCSLPVDKMDDEQARAVLIGKTLNLLAELTAEAMIADGGFKLLVSTEEPIFINEKYKPPFMYLPTAKHVIACNTLPKITTAAEPVLNRLLIVPMTRVIPKDDQDPELRPRLLVEMPGILEWAIAGAKRLVANGGRFSAVPESGALLAELRGQANPARDFIGEKLVSDPKAAVPLADLTEEFNRWNKGNRRVTVKGFGKMLRQVGEAVKVVRFDNRVVTALIGFRRHGEATPSVIAVDEGAAAAESAEINGVAEGFGVP
jgi:P4 family phage/plasmid primase-like protien